MWVWRIIHHHHNFYISQFALAGIFLHSSSSGSGRLSNDNKQLWYNLKIPAILLLTPTWILTCGRTLMSKIFADVLEQKFIIYSVVWKKTGVHSSKHLKIEYSLLYIVQGFPIFKLIHSSFTLVKVSIWSKSRLYPVCLYSRWTLLLICTIFTHYMCIKGKSQYIYIYIMNHDSGFIIGIAYDFLQNSNRTHT